MGVMYSNTVAAENGRRNWRTQVSTSFENSHKEPFFWEGRVPGVSMP